MGKGVPFNKGFIDIKQANVTWKIPTSEVHCVSTNELEYLYEPKHFAVPLESIDYIDEHIQFTWTLPEGYKPIASVNKESTWYKLKTAKGFLEVAKLFKESKDLRTVYESRNFYVDQHFNVKVLFYTHSLHLPHQPTEGDNLNSIKKILTGLFTSINEKKLNTYNAKESAEPDEKNGLIEKILQSDSMEELKQVIDVEYDHYLSLQDQRQMNLDTKKRKKQNKSLIILSGLVVVILAAWFFTSGAGGSKSEDDQLKAEELEEANKNYENQLASYDAYFNGDFEKALETAGQVSDDPDDFNELFYMELFVRNNKIDEAIEQFPDSDNLVAEQITKFADKDAVLELEADNPYLKFEQALLKEDDKALADIIPELNKPTDRQKELIFAFYLRTDRAKALVYAKDSQNTGWEIKALESQKKALADKVKKMDKKDDKDKIKKTEEDIKKVTKEIESLNEK